MLKQMFNFMHSFAMSVDSYSLFTMTQYKLLYESLFIQIIKRSIIPESPMTEVRKSKFMASLVCLLS